MSSNMNVWVPALSGAIGAALVLGWLMRCFRLSLTAEEIARQIEDLKPKVHRFWLAEITSYFVIATLLTFGWNAVLLAMASWYRVPGSDVRFTAEPILVFWFLPALFLGILASWPPVALGFRWLLGDRYKDLERYRDLRSGARFPRRFTVPFVAGTLLIVAALVLWGLTTIAAFGMNTIRIQSAFGLRKHEFAYSEVTDVYSVAQIRALSGRIIDTPHFVVRFRDGLTWSTHDRVIRTLSNQASDLIQFICERSGKEIQNVQLLPGE
ncbi:MAG TPA: hypothetical protein VJZ71_18085 [Phycisphaerae bacterium]|nr:hypothetical protein [Phycisphaerae bacterium]